MAERTRAAGGRPRFWVKHQGQEVRLIEQEERPEALAKDGERAIRLLGPFKDKDAAKEMADRITKRTTRWQAEREGQN